MHKRCKYIYLNCQKRILLPKVCRYIWLCITKLRFMEKDKSKTVFTWCRYIRPENKLHVYLMYVGTPGKQVMWRLVNHRLMQERRPNLIGSWSTEKKNTKNAVTITKTFLKEITYVCFAYITLLIKILISWLLFWQIVDLVGKSLLSPIRDSLYILGLLQIGWLLRSLLIEKWSKRYVIAYILE